MRKRRNDLIIGIFALVAILVTGSLIVKFGGGRKRGRHYTLTVYFSDVSGLIEKAPVYYAGVECGSVDRLIPPSAGVRYVGVVLRINEKTIIRKQDVVTISSINMLGDRVVRIEPGDVTAPALAPGSTFRGVDPISITDVFTDALGILTDEQFKRDLHDTVAGLRELVSEQNTEFFKKTLLNLYLASQHIVEDLDKVRDFMGADKAEALESIIKNLEAASRDLPQLTAQLSAFINRNTGNVEELIVSLTKSSSDISSFIASLKVLLREISKGEGTLGKLIFTSELHDNLTALVRGLRLYGLLGYQNILHKEELEKRRRKEIWVQ